MLGGIRGIDQRDEGPNAGRRRVSIGRSSFESYMLAEQVETENPLTPDDSETNLLDTVATQFFYNQCQELGVQLIIVPPEVGSVACKGQWLYADLSFFAILIITGSN